MKLKDICKLPEKYKITHGTPLQVDSRIVEAKNKLIDEISNIDIDLNKVISQEDLSKMLDEEKIVRAMFNYIILPKGISMLSDNEAKEDLAKTILKGDIWKR